MNALTVEEARRHVAQLFSSILDEVLTPRQALNGWPENKSTLTDPSLQAARDFLWHLEADEDLQRREVFYMDVQWQTLAYMAKVMASGAPLPGHLTAMYRTPWQLAYYTDSAFIRTWVDRLQAIWQGWRLAYKKATTVQGTLDAWSDLLARCVRANKPQRQPATLIQTHYHQQPQPVYSQHSALSLFQGNQNPSPLKTTGRDFEGNRSLFDGIR
jgi:hypothetical protein